MVTTHEANLAVFDAAVELHGDARKAWAWMLTVSDTAYSSPLSPLDMIGLGRGEELLKTMRGAKP